jgi:uncharacterized membrane protein YtjA (UPF0391 family)
MVRRGAARTREIPMLGWALTFLIVALIAAALGFGGIAGTAVGIAKIIFFVAIILFLISAVAGAMRGRSI